MRELVLLLCTGKPPNGNENLAIHAPKGYSPPPLPLQVYAASTLGFSISCTVAPPPLITAPEGLFSSSLVL